MAEKFPRRVGDAEMPDGMQARHGVGDVEELTVAVLPDFDGVEVPAEPAGDVLELEAVDADHGELVDDLERMAAGGQDRSDRQAVDRQERADDDAAALVERFDAGLPADFEVTD